MNVYEPPEDPLVLFVGTSERKDSLKTMVKRLLPTIGVLALASVAVQRFLWPRRRVRHRLIRFVGRRRRRLR